MQTAEVRIYDYHGKLIEKCGQEPLADALESLAYYQKEIADATAYMDRIAGGKDKAYFPHKARLVRTGSY